MTEEKILPPFLFDEISLEPNCVRCVMRTTDFMKIDDSVQKNNLF